MRWQRNPITHQQRVVRDGGSHVLLKAPGGFNTCKLPVGRLSPTFPPISAVVGVEVMTRNFRLWCQDLIARIRCVTRRGFRIHLCAKSCVFMRRVVALRVATAIESLFLQFSACLSSVSRSLYRFSIRKPLWLLEATAAMLQTSYTSA